MTAPTLSPLDAEMAETKITASLMQQIRQLPFVDRFVLVIVDKQGLMRMSCELGCQHELSAIAEELQSIAEENDDHSPP